MKRGRPPLPPDQVKSVRVSVRVSATVADGIFQLAGRNRLTLSQITQSYFERLLARERQLVSDQIQRNGGALTQ